MTERPDRFAGHIAVVGSGLAGMITALTLAPQPVVLLTRAALGAESSSTWAQGALLQALAKATASNFIWQIRWPLAMDCAILMPQPRFYETRQRRSRHSKLWRAFRPGPERRLPAGAGRAHCHRRIVHVEGDGSGTAIVRALVDRVRHTPSITVMEGVEVRRLLKAGDTLCGLLCATPADAVLIPAAAIVLATGGLGGLYQATTTPTSNYGQGIMIAARACRRALGCW